MRSTLRRLVAEFIGTFALVFIGGGAVVMDGAQPGSLGLVGIALAHAFVLAVMVTVMVRISGAHFNPAVTFAVWMAGRIDLRRGAAYVGTQLAAAVVAALCIKWLYPVMAADAMSLGVPRLGPSVTMTQAVMIEAILTFFLVSAVFGTVVSAHAPRVGGFAIGLVLLFDILAGGPLTGSAVNPARAFGPALIANDWHAHIAYWLGPALGAALAGFLWAKLLLPHEGEEPA